MKGKELLWDHPENVKKFCIRYSSPDHAAKECDSIQSRGRKPTPKHIAAAYRRFNHDVPSSHGRNARNPSNNNRRNSSANRDRSNSRSHSRGRNNNNNNNNKNIKVNNKKSYADAASSSSSLSSTNSLNASIHAPSSNSNNNKDKGKQMDNNINPALIKTLATAMDRLEFLTGQLTEWRLAINNLDKRLNRIESELKLSPIEELSPQSQHTSASSVSVPSISASANDKSASSVANTGINVTFPSPITASVNLNNNTNTQNLPSVEDISGVLNEVSNLKNMFSEVLKQFSVSSGSNTSPFSNNQ